MKYLDCTLPGPAENLALDEVLLEDCEAGGSEVLRTWEPREPFVVLGYGNVAEAEVNRAACAREGVPILRRTSGGGAVVQGPGCLCYAVALRIDRHPALAGIPSTNRYVLGVVAAALAGATGQLVELAGETDLTVGGRKCAGNSQRRRQAALLFHGSLLLRADLARIERLLPMPSRRPSYRGDRVHRDFLVNLDLEPDPVKAGLRSEWGATGSLAEWSAQRVEELVREKFGNAEWTFR